MDAVFSLVMSHPDHPSGDPFEESYTSAGFPGV